MLVPAQTQRRQGDRIFFLELATVSRLLPFLVLSNCILPLTGLTIILNTTRLESSSIHALLLPEGLIIGPFLQYFLGVGVVLGAFLYKNYSISLSILSKMKKHSGVKYSSVVEMNVEMDLFSAD